MPSKIVITIEKDGEGGFDLTWEVKKGKDKAENKAADIVLDEIKDHWDEGGIDWLSEEIND